MTKTFCSIIATLLIAIAAHCASAASPITITPETAQAATAIPPDFLGLSFETKLMLPDESGRHYFRADNQPLIAMFKTLGVKNLRIGGNTVDTPSVPIPTHADIDDLFAFAKAADVKVIYSVRLRGNASPAEDAAIAKYVLDHYAPLVEGIAVGNEPNLFAREYPKYHEAIDKFYADILAVRPDAKFCGPSTENKPQWVTDYTRDQAHSGHIQCITAHWYVGGSARKVTDPAAGRDRLLSAENLAAYEKYEKAWVPYVLQQHLPYRLEETNSFYNGGAKDVSNTLAASLWALDYLYFWAQHEAAGINFHTGDKVAAGDSLTPCWYAAYWTSPAGYHAHAVGYAMKAFDLAGHGRLVPLHIADPASLNLRAYAVQAADGPLFLTLINKEHGPSAREAAITIPGTFTRAQTLALSAPNHDPAATEGLTLGGAPIADDASWSGQWSPITADNGHVAITVPAASALLVRLDSK